MVASAETLRQWQSLVAATTPAPWAVFNTFSIIHRIPGELPATVVLSGYDLNFKLETGCQTAIDADFIAASRDMVPALISDCLLYRILLGELIDTLIHERGFSERKLAQLRTLAENLELPDNIDLR